MKLLTKLHRSYTIELTEDEAALLLDLLANDVTSTATQALSLNLITELRKYLNANS